MHACVFFFGKIRKNCPVDDVGFLFHSIIVKMQDSHLVSPN